MKKYTIYSLIFVTVILLLSYCKKESTLSGVEVGYEYYPNEIGYWVVYDVDSIVWNDVEEKVRIDTFSFQIKEIVESYYEDNEGRNTQRIERYYRNNINDEWVLVDVWASNRTLKTAEKVEENIRFVKLAFPVSENDRWDGNAYNIFGEGTNDSKYYEYEDVHQPYVLDGVNYDSTLTVIQFVDTTNFVNKNNQYEVYAKNIGMIFRKKLSVTWGDAGGGSFEAKRGEDCIYRLHSYKQ